MIKLFERIADSLIEHGRRVEEEKNRGAFKNFKKANPNIVIPGGYGFDSWYIILIGDSDFKEFFELPIGVFAKEDIDFAAYYLPNTYHEPNPQIVPAPVGVKDGSSERFKYYTFDRESVYGIHFPEQGYRVFSWMLRSAIDLKVRSNLLPKFLQAGFVKVYYHEVGHYIIERNAYLIADRFGFENAYSSENKDILSEEAFCNSVAHFCLNEYLTTTVGHTQPILGYMVKTMRNQPAGYKDFFEITDKDRQTNSSDWQEFQKVYLKAILARIDSEIGNIEAIISDYALSLLKNFEIDHWPPSLSDNLVKPYYYRVPLHLQRVSMLINNEMMFQIAAGWQVAWFDGNISHYQKPPYSYNIDEIFLKVQKVKNSKDLLIMRELMHLSVSRFTKGSPEPFAI